MSSASAYEDEFPIVGTFRMTINSIKDDEFEVDEDGVWLVNSEIIATIFLNPDSILYIISVESDRFNEVYRFSGKYIVESYGDTARIRLPLGTEFNCNGVFRMVVCYGSLDNSSEQIFLAADEFKIIDYVQNEDCLNAYNTATLIKKPVFASDDKKQYFDLVGRRLTSPPSSGIYIINGKKEVRRVPLIR